MKRLPGRQSPRWLRILAATFATAVGTIWLLSLLPFLLLFSLVFGILLIPILQRLREEIERVNHGSSEQRSPEYHSTDRRSTVDITPWHRQLALIVTQLRNRFSAMRR